MAPMLQRNIDVTVVCEGSAMLDMLKDYLQIGIAVGAEPFSTWPLMLAAALIAMAIMRRQSDE
jgi:hypothetical protein